MIFFSYNVHRGFGSWGFPLYVHKSFIVVQAYYLSFSSARDSLSFVNCIFERIHQMHYLLFHQVITIIHGMVSMRLSYICHPTLGVPYILSHKPLYYTHIYHISALEHTILIYPLQFYINYFILCHRWLNSYHYWCSITLLHYVSYHTWVICLSIAFTCFHCQMWKRF